MTHSLIFIRSALVMMAIASLSVMTACPEPAQVTYACKHDEDCPGNLRCNVSTLTCVELTQTCGDAIKQPYEDCDPREQKTYCDYGSGRCQTCTDSCTLEDLGEAPFCGDGILQREEEECDEGPDPDPNCDYGLTSCKVCSPTCEFVDGQVSFCGDKRLDTSHGESCDEGLDVTLTCAYGMTNCTVCDLECTQTPGKTSFCGDGVVDDDMEQCDAGPDPDLTCAYGRMNCMVCNSACMLQAGLASFCGDGIKNPGEDCDPGMEQISLDCPYDEPDCTVCTAGCRIIRGNDTGSCGDATIQSDHEQCDGTVGITSETCRQQQNLSYGQAVCDASCQIESSSCFGIVQIAAGLSHTCGLTQDGRVYCWGDNGIGQLGIGTNISSPVPVQVPGLNRVTQLVAGSTHTCALTQVGEVNCWGNNSAGQLGTGDTLSTNTPAPVTGLPIDIVEIASGGFHVCARSSSKEVYCWGERVQGALSLDNISTEDVLSAIKITLAGVDQIAAGGAGTCAIKSQSVYCWGATILGTETVANWTPTIIAGASNLTQLAMGEEHACGLTPTNTVICWGNNAMGQLGSMDTMAPRTQVVSVLGPGGNTVTPLDNITAIFARGSASCALSATDEVFCWGDNNQGQLGIATSGPPEPRAVSVPGLKNRQISTMGMGFMHTCVATATGEVSCSGDNAQGQLGIGVVSQARFVHTNTTGW